MKVGRSVWYCKKLENGNYAKPKEIVTRFNYFTVMGKSGYSDIIQFGNQISSFLTAIAQPYDAWENVFESGDLFYCNGVAPSKDEDWYGEKANYVVDDVDYGNTRIKITLKRVAK